MRILNNKGFFLVETLIVTMVVSVAMVFLYSQMSRLIEGYELRLTYNKVDKMYATTEINELIVNDTTAYTTLTSSADINTIGYKAISCESFESIPYCNNLFSVLGVDTAIVTKYNTVFLKSVAPTTAGFDNEMKVFIGNIENNSTALSNEFRLIVEYQDGTFATIRLTKHTDTEPPVITGEETLFGIAGETYSYLTGLSAVDNSDGDVTNKIACSFVTGTTYSCSVTDSAGNVSLPFRRIVTTVPKVTTLSYTGNKQFYTAYISGYYKIELWGAQGSGLSPSSLPGLGGYASGVMYITAGDILNVFVGGSPANPAISTAVLAGGYNGGGAGGRGRAATYYQGGAGGGATDIRYNGTAISNRILVAGGGGGGSGYNNASYVAQGGYGGGAGVAGNGTYSANTYSGYGATQSAGGVRGSTATVGTSGGLGIGGNGGYATSTYGGAGGGGGGYWGGGGGSTHYGAGGGGSSYYDTVYFVSASLIAGNASMPNWAGTSNITGNNATGNAKITFLTR